MRHEYNVPGSIGELFANGEAQYSIYDDEKDLDNNQAMQLFVDVVGIPSEAITLDDGTLIYVEHEGKKLTVASYGLGDFFSHGFDVEWDKIPIDESKEVPSVPADVPVSLALSTQLSVICHAYRAIQELGEGWVEPHPYTDRHYELHVLEAGSTGVHEAMCDGTDYWIGPDGDPSRPILVKRVKKLEEPVVSSATDADAEPALITVVCDEGRSTAIYLNGVLQDREDGNDAYEIERLTKSRPCVVTTRNPGGWYSAGRWPKLLSDVPS